MAREVSVRSIDELTNRRLSRKRCIYLHNLFTGYYTLDEVSQLRQTLQSLKTVRECFEDVFVDRGTRHAINEQAVAALCGCISGTNTFFQRVLVCVCAFWFGGWKSAHRIFFVIGGLFLPHSMRKGCRSFLKLLGGEV